MDDQQTTISINLKPHLREYITMKYSMPIRVDIVELPPSSELYCLLLDKLQRMPKPHSYYMNQGNTTFRLPNRNSGKRLAVYRWLSDESIASIQNWIEVMMWSDFHQFIEQQLHILHQPLNLSIQRWMAMYGITQLSEDAYKKNYQRWRKRGRVNKYKNDM